MFRCPNRAPTHRHLEVHHVIHLATRITGPKMVDVCDEFVMKHIGKMIEIYVLKWNMIESYALRWFNLLFQWGRSWNTKGQFKSSTGACLVCQHSLTTPMVKTCAPGSPRYNNRPLQLRSCIKASHHSMDWLKGKSTGNHGFYHEL